MFLHTIKPGNGARKPRKRIGRGEGSGHGGTSTKGHKGQKARAGGYHKRGFEGGQMPLVRRLPKRGFVNIFRKEYAICNVGDFADLPKDTVVDAAFLREQGWAKKAGEGLRVLGNGELKVSLTVKAQHFSESARKKIESAGGQVVILENHG